MVNKLDKEKSAKRLFLIVGSNYQHEQGTISKMNMPYLI